MPFIFTRRKLNKNIWHVTMIVVSVIAYQVFWCFLKNKIVKGDVTRPQTRHS